ncbi:MAG: acetyl-CoA carboxylase biotin carboxylase subunit [Ignavibacteria bacterium]|nr:acetyl-CoA carboxylase biotin carboxylase subunit [Ignavibacteria bacterium]
MFKKILIVNRGEIAIRLMRACREMGIGSVAIYAPTDKTSLHVRYADEAYQIDGTTIRDTYLNIPEIIRIAHASGAEAIHPGYGFLSENELFIREVEKHGLVFIGPSADSVEKMGSKTAARQLMRQKGVPIVPGTIEPLKNIEEAQNFAESTGFPLLLKASAGGGGKGMKLVQSMSELHPAFQAAQREALNAFGDDSVYIERYVVNPKHIEVQIIADKFGNYVHLFERECSVQRRHQKIIEEAPAPSITPTLRKQITEAAINAAKACNYINAGTIEFLLDSSGDFYFLEMNTRLQVEHPVTEFVSGIDIVKEQISIAAGNPLSFSQNDLVLTGHALEARVYAEDAANGFLPSTGYIHTHKIPSGPGIRVDTGLDMGSTVSQVYDPLLTKVSVFGRDRNAAIAKMRSALKDYQIGGVITNIPLLLWVLNQKKFTDGDYSINFIENEFLSGETAELLRCSNEEDKIAVATLAGLLRRKGHTGKKKHLHGAQKSDTWKNQIYE